MEYQFSLGEFITPEEQTFHLIESHIRGIIHRNFLKDDHLNFQKRTGYWSIAYDSALIARIHFGKNVSYFAVEYHIAKPILDNAQLPYSSTNSDPDFIRIALTTPEDILPLRDVISAITQSVLDAIPSVFSCCSRYLACSDTKQCLQPDDGLRRDCSYRKNLAAGHIFHGKNRNID